MTYQNQAYAGGFDEPVFQSQSVFKALMDAMSRPGSIHTLDAIAMPPAPMSRGAGAIALTLCDHDTPVSLSMPLVEAGVPGWLAFQTGALITSDRTEAQFTFLDASSSLPALSTFSVGDQEYPDRSATIVLEIIGLHGGIEYTLEGPGIEKTTVFAPQGLPDHFAALWQQNAALFPRGVDLILVAGSDIACLPRTTKIRKERD
jgi:alpha-D-ribose 1-methylphosphonate 5-triphosphate synthase subunit PhnH